MTPESRLNAFERPVGAFRDVGVQMFDWFKFGNDWEWSYAIMMGNGNGLKKQDEQKKMLLAGVVIYTQVIKKQPAA